MGEVYTRKQGDKVETDMRDAGGQLIALIGERASQNELKAGELEAEDLKLKALINPRRLIIAQQRAITQNCSKFAKLIPQKRVKLVSYWLDVEAFVLAEEIVTALRAKPCGMFLDDDAMTIGGGRNLASGIHVFGAEPELGKKIANAINRNGGAIGAAFNPNDPTAGAMIFDGNQSAHAVTILIGVKSDRETDKEILNITPATSSH